MLFNSLQFLIFFPVVTILYFMLPHKFRWSLLLTASCIFYMFFIPSYILILIFTIIIDYFAGILIENAGKNKKIYLIVSIVANVGVLAIFKYFNFINDNVRELAQSIGWNYGIENLKMILPIGLSFHTFQAMSYTIEVYRGHQKAEKHFGIYALYVMFYPQLVAGPIERPQNILHQFYEKHELKYKNVASGLKLMAWGMFKKVVIADGIAPFVNGVYANPQNNNYVVLALAAFFFAFQIYCDFSGYSDIARGSARVMGFHLMLNFDMPYFSKSLSEFWRKWHISLSTWFRDYVYIPMGGSRRGLGRTLLNLMITFTISGIWHGANWTFVIWGMYHGGFLIIESLFKTYTRGKLKTGIPAVIKTPIAMLYTFTLVYFGWIYFRANNFADAQYVIKSILNGIISFEFPSGLLLRTEINGLDYTTKNTLGYILVIFMLLLVEYLNKQYNLVKRVQALKPVGKYPIYALLLIFILLFGEFNNSQFIYFQF